MTVRNQVEQAAAAITRARNADGGVPAVRADHGSGCWTTADVLHPILYGGLVLEGGLAGCLEMLDFILQNQITEPGIENGGWPLALGKRGSAMTTGHCCLALIRALKVFDHDQALAGRMRSAVDQGMEWLRQRQNDDGGWGTEPSSGGEGQRSALLATAYALMPFIELGEDALTPGPVRDATTFLKRLRNGSDGSWGSQPSLPGDACSTSRASVALLRSRSCTPGDRLMRQALDFVLRSRDTSTGMWEVAEEPFFYSDAGGYISFHQNTPCDVLVFFVEMDYRGPEMAQLVSWLLSTQDKTSGLWPLASPNWRSKEIVTWSTGEWMYALDLANRRFGRAAILSLHLSLDARTVRRTKLMLMATTVSGAVALTGFTLEAVGDRVVGLYDWLPTWGRWVIATIIVGAVVSALSDGVKTAVRSLLARATSLLRGTDVG